MTILMVLVMGVAHPTWAWIDSERYSYQNHFLYAEKSSLGLSSTNACLRQKYIMEMAFPTLRFQCQQKV